MLFYSNERGAVVLQSIIIMKKQFTTSLFLVLFSTSLMAEQIDFEQVIKTTTELMQKYHYNPAELNSQEYQLMLDKMQALSRSAESKQVFIQQFNQIWQSGPFSHVRIDHAHQSVEALANYLDTMNVGGKGAQLTWQNEIAVLTVNTMMGMDTIEQIEQAYDEIARKGSEQLIIDLRMNNGGAFAVKPLIGHLVSEPLDIGVFVSQGWFSQGKKEPALSDLKDIQPWDGWSIKRFWQDAQNNAVTRIQIKPELPYFAGKVWVLTSKNTASAAELASDALSALPNVTLVGESTAGEMLSQKMYEVGENLHLFLPIADYYSFLGGRIEGKGVQPDVQTNSDKAFDESLRRALLRE